VTSSSNKARGKQVRDTGGEQMKKGMHQSNDFATRKRGKKGEGG